MTLNKNINWLPITQRAFDGKRARGYFIDECSQWNTLKKCKAFRLPRKLKKKVKIRLGYSFLKVANIKFYLDVYKTVKYYNCAVLKEGVKSEIFKANTTLGYSKSFKSTTVSGANELFNSLVAEQKRFMDYRYLNLP